MKPLVFNFFGIETTVDSDNKIFLDTAREGLSYFLKENDNAERLIENQRVRVTFHSKQRCSPEININGFSKIGSHAYSNGNALIYRHGHLIVTTTCQSDGLEINAQYCTPTDIRNRIREGLLSTVFLSQRNYFLLIRYLILYPVFMLLEARKNIFLLHGSAVEMEGRGIIFAGLGSVGKSLLAVSLTLDHSAKFLTDNFLLFDEEYIYPFPEFLRLSEDARGRIENRAALGDPVLHRHNRDYFVLNPQSICKRAKSSLIFMPRLSSKTYIKKLSSAVALDRLLLANDHVREFHQHHLGGLLRYNMEGSSSVYKSRMMTLEKLLDGLSVYELGVCATKRPGEEVMGVLRDVS